MRIVQIPVETLSGQALDGLLEEFVTRDGTDYGAEERTLDDERAPSGVNFSVARSSSCSILIHRPPTSS